MIIIFGWLKSLSCLKKCGMSIEEIRKYLDLCLKGESTIPERKIMLDLKRKKLIEEQNQIQASIDFIDWKQDFYDSILSGKTKYFSYLKNQS